MNRTSYQVRRIAGKVSRYLTALWGTLPGPWPVKTLLIVLAVAEPGPFGEMALLAYANYRLIRNARQS